MSLGTATGGQIADGQHAEASNSSSTARSSASKDVPADDKVHDVTFDVPIDKSSWVALRHFPQMHTNPVNVIVGGKPIRASRESAKWCIGVIEQLWKVRGQTASRPR